MVRCGKRIPGAAGCRITQAAFKGDVFRQFARGFKCLRDKGKSPMIAEEKKYRRKSWAEILTAALEEETPDQGRLEALKAMLYALNQLNATEAQRVVSYQLLQMAKALTWGELLLLKAVYDAYRNSAFSGSPQETLRWRDRPRPWGRDGPSLVYPGDQRFDRAG